MGERHVRRPRLIAQLTSAPVALIEAGGGFGKSALVAELRERLGVAAVDAVLTRGGSVLGALRTAARRAGLSDVAAALDVGDLVETLPAALAREPAPVLLVVDEAQEADAVAVAQLVALMPALPDGHRLVIAGRRLDPALGTPLLDAAALTFTEGEVAELIGDPVQARAVHAATGGWPAACAVAAALPAGVRLAGPSLAPLLDELLAGEPGLAVLGHAPLLSDPVATALAGPQALARLRRTGVPLRERGRGWWQLPDPVREELGTRMPLALPGGRAAAAAYVAAGELRAALGLLAADPEGVAELLEATPWIRLAELELSELRVLLGALPEAALTAHPGALVNGARVAERRADSDARAELLERAVALAVDGSARREAQAELAMAVAPLRPESGIAETAETVLATAGPTEHVARARARSALAWIAAWRGDPRSLRAAETGLEQSAAEFRLAGEPEWAAAALMALGYRVCFARGDLEPAVRHLLEALELVPSAGAERASMATFLATVLAYTGRFDEAENSLVEAEAIARSLGDSRALAYADWSRAVLASQRGDAATTRARIRSAERHFGPWFAHPTGAEFLVDAALAFGRVGDEAAARDYAERARAHADAVGYPEIALLATGATEARFGDPDVAAAALVAYAGSDQPSARDEWHILLLRAHAARRAGAADAGALAAEAAAAAAALGRPDLLALHEPDLMPAAAAPALAVRLLGAFAVTAGGREVSVPAGRPTTLVKLLAVRRDVVGGEEATETLWPGVDPETGRARLRNLLNRLRAACGELVERTSEGLRLSPQAEVDVTRFQEGLDGARAAAPELRAGSARAALAAYTGELLPDDRYAEWATLPRERARRGQLELLDLLADDAVDRGDVDEAIRLLERAVDAEPLDEDRLLRAAELRLFQGRRGSARAHVERVLALRAELGIAVDPRLRRLADSVGA